MSMPTQQPPIITFYTVKSCVCLRLSSSFKQRKSKCVLYSVKIYRIAFVIYVDTKSAVITYKTAKETNDWTAHRLYFVRDLGDQNKSSTPYAISGSCRFNFEE